VLSLARLSRNVFCMVGEAVARFAGSIVFVDLFLGLTPQALCFRLLRRLTPRLYAGVRSADYW